MAQFCVMVKGPCRGKMCDFWARVKIRKASTEDLASGIRECSTRCKKDDSRSFDEIVRLYWRELGIRDRERLCEEEPDLCEKMTRAEDLAH